MALKIYYLDDEKVLCENFEDYFASKEVSVTTFTDPKAAIEAINKNPPDLLFIDYRLPGTNGDEVAKALDPKLPKFLITGEISVNTEYQFNGIFSKPYFEEEVSKVLDSVASKKAE